ncbi:MAG: hypothetical protein C4531_02735 [Desulfurivibrio sp.]|nr:MAG: hypothetical protein C4531_02735 [Desulfurivibrio sp.]
MADADAVLSDYRSSIREINRLLVVGLLFALATHVYVIEPYFQLKGREQSLQNSLPAMEQSIKALSGQAEKINQVKQAAGSALEQIRRELNLFPDELRDALPALRDALTERDLPVPGPGVDFAGLPPDNLASQPYMQQQYMQQPLAPGAITLPAGITTFAAAVNWYINDWFGRLLADLENRVVKPVAELDGAGSSGGAGDLRAISRQAVDAVKERISAIDPDFWHSYGGRGGKLDVAVTLRDHIEAAFAPLEGQVVALLAQTNRQLQGQEQELAALRQTIEGAREQIRGLSDRLQAIESPFGPLPLSMTDVIRLFPFLLVALALRLALVMREGAAQKSLFLQLTVGPPEAAAARLRRYQLRSLLLGPSSRLLGLAAMSAWLTVLLAVFSRAAWLIGRSPHILGEGGELQTLVMQPQLYQAGCLAGLALLAGTAAYLLLLCRQAGTSLPDRQARPNR